MDSAVCLLPDRTTETTLPDVKLLAMDYSTLDYDCVYEGRTQDTSIENCCY
jgi:hypothetical protein